MDADTLQQIQAEALRARITLEPQVAPNLEESKLSVTLGTLHGERQFRFSLHSDGQENIANEGGWFSEGAQWTAYTLKLSESAIVDFKAMQAEFLQQSPESMGLNVKVIMHRPDDHTNGVMTVELKLFAEDDFFTLVDEYHYTIGEKREL
ncbi:MAG: hypothetical protein ACFHVJ_00515 [Aestuariibacter sp.]